VRVSVDRQWFIRHRALTLLLVNGVLLVGLAGLAEIFLRIYTPYNPGYYTSVSGTSRELVYAYGTIKINSDGFPDDEFELTKDERVGYFGDSVTYGVGAGFGFRVSEYLEEAYPDYEHLNLGGIGLSISQNEIEYCTGLAERFGLTHAIYLFNLNDVIPTEFASGEHKPAGALVRSWLSDRFDWLRGRSYLYTNLRNVAKTFLVARGLGFHGLEAYEFYPRKNEPVFAETAGRVNDFHDSLARAGVKLHVVILPYEMQISQEAEETYSAMGVQWEEGFIDRTPQETFRRHLDPEIPVTDAYLAFVDEDATSQSRKSNPIGEYFVYDKGDKLDWNHPTRIGHRKIADLMVAGGVLGPVGVPLGTSH
jgi:hypothetical protein